MRIPYWAKNSAKEYIEYTWPASHKTFKKHQRERLQEVITLNYNLHLNYLKAKNGTK